MSSKTPGQVLFEDEYLGAERLGAWDKMTDCQRSVFEVRAQKVIAHVNPPMDKPDSPGWWWLNNNGYLSVKQVKQGKTCLVTGYCDVAKYVGEWRRINEPEFTKQSLGDETR